MQGQSFLSPVEFQFIIDRMPTVQYYIQSVNIPAISSGYTEQITPFKNTYRHGDKLTYDDLYMTVAVDENLSSYLETWSWLKALTKPEEFQQYANILGSTDGLYSDATLIILNNFKNPNIRIKFADLFPTTVGAITLATTSSDVPVPTVDLTFKYNKYSIEVQDTSVTA